MDNKLVYVDSVVLHHIGEHLNLLALDYKPLIQHTGYNYLIELAQYCQRSSEKGPIRISNCRILLDETNLTEIVTGGGTKVWQTNIYLEEYDTQYRK